MFRAFGCALVVGCFFAAPIALATPRTWDYHADGSWQAVSPSTTAPVSDPTLSKIEQMLENGRAADAKQLGVEWFKAHRQSPLADRALFVIAEAENRSGDPIVAFYYYDELLDEHPESELYSTAMQKQYEIADAFLRGKKRKFLGMPILGAEDEAIEMLYRIQQRSPGSPIAERALLRTANYYFATREYDLAEDAYGAFIRQFSRSPSVPEARLRQAYSAYAQFHGPRFEVTPLIDARERFLAVEAAHPDLARRADVRAMLAQIDATMAQKLYLRADFYHRTHEPQAAAFIYRYLIEAYPSSSDAAKAKAQLAKLPAWTKRIPEPKVQQDAEALRTHELAAPQVR
jgi:outer membrane protein assembly factor BamD (BamD/ComL family)